MDIVAVEKIEGLPTAFSAAMPVFGVPGGGGVVAEQIPTGEVVDVVAPEDVYSGPGVSPGLAEDLGAYQEQLRSSEVTTHTPWASLMHVPEIWRVNALEEVGDDVRVNIGRAGVTEFMAQTSKAGADPLNVGDPVIGLPQTEMLHHASTWSLMFNGAEVEFEFDEGQPAWEQRIWIPLLRLHCPRRQDCAATYTAEARREEEINANIDILGSGGGGGVRFACRMQHEYEAQGRCMEMVVPGTLRLRPGRTLFNGTAVAYGFRATVEVSEEDKRTLKDRDIPPESDGCNWEADTAATLPAFRRFDRSGVSGDAEGNMLWETFELERTVTGTVNVGLQFGQAPVNFAVDYMRSSSHRTEIKTGLAPGTSYLAYQPGKESTEFCWTIQ